MYANVERINAFFLPACLCQMALCLSPVFPHLRVGHENIILLQFRNDSGSPAPPQPSTTPLHCTHMGAFCWGCVDAGRVADCKNSISIVCLDYAVVLRVGWRTKNEAGGRTAGHAGGLYRCQGEWQRKAEKKSESSSKSLKKQRTREKRLSLQGAWELRRLDNAICNALPCCMNSIYGSTTATETGELRPESGDLDQVGSPALPPSEFAAPGSGNRFKVPSRNIQTRTLISLKSLKFGPI